MWQIYYYFYSVFPTKSHHTTEDGVDGYFTLNHQNITTSKKEIRNYLSMHKNNIQYYKKHKRPIDNIL